jgi:predicted flap endonuclease-1-like 5' DNA nuclease
MLKMLIGAAIVVALVGYGIITPETLSSWGDTLRQWINDVATWVQDATKGDALEQIKDKING